MSEADVIKILIAGQAGLLAMFVWHLFKCRDVRIDIATIRGSIEGIAREIGTHETGIRGSVHETANRVTELGMKVSLLERRGHQR
jgi:hypothetical protein